MIAAISHCTTRGPSHGLGWPDAGATRAGSSGLPGLDAATLQAVKQWQKLPGRKPSYPRNVSVNPCCPPKMHRLDPWKVQDYKLLRQIGHGRASVVYHGICLISHQTVAVKVYQKDKLSDVTRRQVEREIEIHSRVHHQHIIDLYAVFEDESSIYMVEEFAARGDLMQEKKARGGHMTEHQVVRDVLQPFLSTLNFLHSQGIVHRDIKPENLLFTANGTLKVTDFGTAIDLRRERAVSRLGTLDYMAPEILRCPNKLHPAENKENTDIHYNTHVDNWAVGVLAYELLVGRPPFEKESIEQTLQEIMQREPDIPSWLSEECQDFISQCLRKDAAQRPTVVQLLKHPWTTVHGRRMSTVVYSQPPSPDKALAQAHQRSMSSMQSAAELDQPDEPPGPSMHGRQTAAPMQFAMTPARQCWQASPSRMVTPGGGRRSRFSAQPQTQTRQQLPKPRVLYVDICCSPREASQAASQQAQHPTSQSSPVSGGHSGAGFVESPAGTGFARSPSVFCHSPAGRACDHHSDQDMPAHSPAGLCHSPVGTGFINHGSPTGLGMARHSPAGSTTPKPQLAPDMGFAASPGSHDHENGAGELSPSPTRPVRNRGRLTRSVERLSLDRAQLLDEFVLQALQNNALAASSHRSHSLPCTPRPRSPTKVHNKSPSPSGRRARQARHMSLTGSASCKLLSLASPIGAVVGASSNLW